MSSFRKRNVVLNPPSSSPSQQSSSSSSVAQNAPPALPPPGTRPSPVDGRLVTSTGTPSLDSLLAGHSGLPLGCSLLIEEPGTTDYGGALLRYYGAEGITQGHTVTVIGFGEQWLRDLPAVTGSADTVDAEAQRELKKPSERMKIAWRYERLGAFGSGIGGSRAESYTSRSASNPSSISGSNAAAKAVPFCHTYDLTKRLTIPSNAALNFIPPPPLTSATPFSQIITRLASILSESDSRTIHRIIIPSLLSPALYPPHASNPQNLIQFVHSLRALIRRYRSRITVMISLPTELYPRSTGLIRWVEMLSDGVMELVPLPRRTAAKTSAGDNEPQGLVRFWKLPIVSEKGGGMGATLAGQEDLAFVVTRRRFEIMAYTLPPADEEEDDHGHDHGGGAMSRATKVDLDF
ncbi:PAXNEB-domain-containing protein [Ascodesmis nigricans]|uniref:Elongator complex protein 4 n=1 Tax=Ascodesmis nigricans TaxID=341454 RepID=A0A4S2N273_9PEZI|nr:PAXNEB-domain-containing protein [Ascodesmis nigricans]